MKLLEKHFDLAFAAPDGIQKLRELILTLAMQGKLVPQDPNDQPASELLKAIEAERQRLVKEEKIKQPKSLPEIKLEDLPYGLPQGWEWVRLGEIGETNIGLTYAPSDLSDTGTPVLRSNNIQNGKLDLTDLKRVNKDIKKNVLVQQGDLLICARNGSKALVGKTALITGLSEAMAFGAFMSIFRSRVNRFLLYFINSPLFRRMIDEVNTMTINQITQNNLRSTICPLPPLAEQHRIVAKIDRLMARCDELEKLRGDRNQKRITIHTAALDRLLTAKESNDFSTAWRFITQHFGELYSVKENVAELRKAILQLAVMGKLVPQNPKDEPASELLKTIEAEKQRLVKKGKIKAQKPLPKISQEEIPYALPEGWKWVRMDDLCIGITSGSTPPNNIFSDKEGIPFLKVYNIRNQKIDFQYKPQFINEEYHLKSKRSCLNPGDVIMNIVGPPLGKVAIIPNHFPEYNCNQAIVFFRPVIKSLNEYLYLYLLSGKFLDKIELIGTAGQDNISVTKSRSILIPLAPLSEQLRIIKKTDFLMDLCDRLEKQIDAATSKRTELLKALMAQV